MDEGLPATNTDNPATKLYLAEPSNGATNLPTTLTLKWEIPADTDGVLFTYKLHIGTDPGLTDVTPIIVAVASNNNSFAMAIKYSLSMFGLFGIIAIGGLSKNTRRTGLLIIPIIMVTGVIFTSCGSGGQGNDSRTPVVLHTSMSYGSYTVKLEPNTTYYWKVVGEDGKKGVTESETFSFKTGQ